MLNQFLIVGLGGALGAMSRYGISLLTETLNRTQFPFATLLANVMGCFLIGLLMGSGHHEKNENLRLAFGVGYLGALTTFSTFGAETIAHTNQGWHWLAALNVGANLLVGLMAVLVGMVMGRRWFG